MEPRFIDVGGRWEVGGGGGGLVTHTPPGARQREREILDSKSVESLIKIVIRLDQAWNSYLVTSVHVKV